MKKILLTSTLLIVAATLAACSATPVRRSVKETWNDSLTASKIRYKMMRDVEVRKSRMHVQVFRGQVTLTGRAVSDTERARAEQLAKSVKRVTAVENYVHVVGGAATAPVAAVAKAPKAGSPVAGVATIEEKVIVTDNIKIEEDFAPAAPARVPTIRESTGSRSATAAKSGKSGKSEPRVANKAKPLIERAMAPKVPASKSEDAAPMSTTTTRAAAATKAPAAKVVGQARTGLPWDGEVYDDDASSIRAKSTPAAAAPKAPTTEGPSPQTPDRSPGQALTPPPTDDLAREAAEELEKLRSKR